MRADAKFGESYEINYRVASNGETAVTQNFHFFNKTSEFFPQQYVIVIGNHDVTGLRAVSEQGTNLPVNVKGEGAQRELLISLPDNAIGVGKQFNWTLTYNTTDVAKKEGQVWKIIIPKPGDAQTADNFFITLDVPAGFGKPFLVRPTPMLPNTWSKAQLTTSGILANYYLGSDSIPNQTYGFVLHYHLYNDRLYPANLEIALPPDTNYQKVLLQTLLPAPVNVRQDADGNWLAKYSLGPAGKLDVLATGSASVYLSPKFAQITIPKFDDYMSAQGFWETDNPKIKSLAAKLRTPEQIYNYVVSTLHYNPNPADKNKRLGSVGALGSPDNAGCLEFTDLFIAVSRAAGVPTRELDGVSSCWPEYYDKEQDTWVMVDPTRGYWDTSHLVLAIKGLDSVYPAIAPEANISYSDRPIDPNTAPNISLRANLPDQLTAGFPFNGTVYVDNNGPTLFSGGKLHLSAQVLDIQGQEQNIPPIPPFGHAELPFTILPAGWNKQGSDIITMSFAQITKNYPVNITPLFENKLVDVIGILTVLGSISIIAQIAWRLLFQKPGGPNHLHRKS
ncbi:MAG: transglutaminase domain-containing protein [Patescibacteria group bacterium]|nr:transglutaminase domain-containing protein [Patescibacteria group bacterium]MCL5431852.1 transglutaminase domain-containing protein [Patescibacteria group bacterium]